MMIGNSYLICLMIMVKGMSKKDDGQTGEGGLDLRSLMYGTLNWLRDDDINNSGDRRRGNPLSFLAQALSKA